MYKIEFYNISDTLLLSGLAQVLVHGSSWRPTALGATDTFLNGLSDVSQNGKVLLAVLTDVHENKKGVRLYLFDMENETLHVSDPVGGFPKSIKLLNNEKAEIFFTETHIETVSLNQERDPWYGIEKYRIEFSDPQSISPNSRQRVSKVRFLNPVWTPENFEDNRFLDYDFTRDENKRVGITLFKGFDDNKNYLFSIVVFDFEKRIIWKSKTYRGFPWYFKFTGPSGINLTYGYKNKEVVVDIDMAKEPSKLEQLLDKLLKR